MLGPDHLAYVERNLARGELGELLRVRVQFRTMATEWSGFLFCCSPDELAGLVAGTEWQIEEIDDADAPMYLAVLARPEASEYGPDH